MNFSWWRTQVFAFEDGQKTLVNANVLLLCLHHPNTFFSHGIHYTEDVNVVAYENLLKDAIQTDECAWSTNTGTKKNNQ